MRFIGFVAVIVTCCIVSPCLQAQDRGFGVGVLIGEPTGFSVKNWTSSTNAIDGGLAWSFTRETSFHVHADYLWHFYNVFETTEKVPLYIGIGGRIKTGRHDKSRVGVRVTGGVAYIFHDAPVDLFMEVAPIIDVAPSTDLEGNIGLGARFYFR